MVVIPQHCHFLLSLLAAQMSSVSANMRKIISHSEYTLVGHCHIAVDIFLEFVLRLLMQIARKLMSAKQVMSLLKCQLLTKHLSPILLSAYAIRFL